MAFPASESAATESVDSPSRIQESSSDRTEAERDVDCKTEDVERYVPDFILEEILIRLPAKFVFQSKCAYKKWLSLTATPSFICYYFLHWQGRFKNSSTTRPWTFLYRCTYDYPSNRIAEERKLSHVYSLDYSSPQLSALASLPHGRMQIIGESNGLLFCNLIDANRYYVCNPITSQWVALPDMPGGRNLLRRRSRLLESRFNTENNEGFVTLVEDGLVTKYKVVVPRGGISFIVFSSDTGEWISSAPASDPSTPLHSACLCKPVAVDGILYWPDHLRGFLLAYDAFEESSTNVRFLSLPRALVGDGYRRMYGVSGGSLRYHEQREMDEGGALRIWELEDFKSGTWSVKHECSWDDVWSPDEDLTETLTEMVTFRSMYFVPVAFHPYDPDIIYLHDGKYIVSYSFQNKRLDVLHDPRTYVPELAWPNARSWFNVMPFSLPLWPSPVPEPDYNVSGAV